MGFFSKLACFLKNRLECIDGKLGNTINRIKTYRDITLPEEEKLKGYIKALARDGFIYETVDKNLKNIGEIIPLGGL